MKCLSGKLAIAVFDVLAARRGYRFTKVGTIQEYKDATALYEENGFTFPAHLRNEVEKYKAGSINFIAYCNDMPVGTVRLGNPSVINRPMELYGVDPAGEHFEIQNLVVKKQYRDGVQFVMLGLFRVLYDYSVRNGIKSWSSCGSQNVYLTMRRFGKNINAVHVDFASVKIPLTQYLYHNKIIETYFTMNVNDFSPWDISKKCVKRMVKKWDSYNFLKAAVIRPISSRYPKILGQL